MAELWPPILRMNRVGATILRNAHSRLNKYSCPKACPDSGGLRCFRHATNPLVGNRRPCCKCCQHENPASEMPYCRGIRRIKHRTKANIVGKYIYSPTARAPHTNYNSFCENAAKTAHSQRTKSFKKARIFQPSRTSISPYSVSCSCLHGLPEHPSIQLSEEKYRKETPIQSATHPTIT